MARGLVSLAYIILLNVRSFALPVYKRYSRDHRTRPVQGVEVNGLFNPMDSLNPQLFKRASEEHGNTITTYRDICKLLPQEKLDSLMADHFGTFITNYDLEVLKSAHINTLRIPVSYNMFLPEANRTDNFPRGECKALDDLIERALDYDMNVWLDLMATPNSQLGTLEQYGNTVTPEIARNVIKHIAEKYDPSDITTILVHPDITFPNTPSNLPPLHPKSIKTTKNSQYHLYREFSSILHRKGHVLAIDTSHNFDWWSGMATFSTPVVLVHSVQTGVLSTHQYSVTRLITGIKADMQYLKDLANDVPVSVTWDASINACVHGKDRSYDCSLSGQLWQAADREPKRGENEETLNDYTEHFALDILRELEKIDVSSWFFRTAKIEAGEAHGQTDIDDERRKLVRRRRPEKIVSGNDFLAMYKYGMFPKSLLSHATKRNKSLFVPVAIGLGVAGAGALGWRFWEDIRKIGNEVVQFVQKLQKPASIVEKPKILPPYDHKSQFIDSTQPMEQPIVSLPPIIPDEFSTPPEITPPIAHKEPPSASIDYIFPLAEFPEIMTQGRDDRDNGFEPIRYLDPYSSGPVIHYPFGYPSEGDPAWAILYNTKNSRVEDSIQKWERPPGASTAAKSHATVEAESLDNRSSVAASVARSETPETSNANGPIDESPRHSFHSTGSESQLSEGISSKDSQYIHSLSGMQRDPEANGLPKQDWTHGISIPHRRRPGSGLQNSETRRHGKVLSVEEKELLDQMMLEGMRRRQKEASFFEEIPEAHQTSVVITKDQSQNQKGNTVEDTSIAVDLKFEKAVNEPILEKAFDPEPLTHAQQEQYTRPHVGTGEGIPDSTLEFAELRRDTRKRRPRSEPKRPMLEGHHIIGGEKARPMTVHAPRNKDMDPNHPRNLKKMKAKTDEYKPYPPPEAKHTIKTHHVETTKIVSKPKGILGIPSTIIVHKKESTQLHPDITTALITAGQEILPPPKNGIGKDPRKAYENVHWTEDEREGHLAYIDSVLNPTKLEGGEGNPGRASRLANSWTKKERMESPKTSPSTQSEPGSKNSIYDQMTSLREHSGHQSQKPVQNTDGHSMTEQHAPKGSVSNHMKSVKDESFRNEDEGKQSELQDLATPSAFGRIISFEADSAQSEDEIMPKSDRDRPKGSISSLSGAFEEGFVRDEGESRSVLEQQYHPKGYLSSRIKCFEQGGVHAEAAPSPASRRLDAQKGRVASRVKFFERGAVRKEDEPGPSGKKLLPKGAVSTRINVFDASSARHLKEILGQNGKRTPAATNARRASFDKINILEESSTRELAGSRPIIERISRHLSVEEQVDQFSKSLSSAGGVVLLNGRRELAARDDGHEIITLSPKLIHPIKNRARPPTKDRLSAVSKDE